MGKFHNLGAITEKLFTVPYKRGGGGRRDGDSEKAFIQPAWLTHKEAVSQISSFMSLNGNNQHFQLGSDLQVTSATGYHVLPTSYTT